jgi:hypothetical protein
MLSGQRVVFVVVRSGTEMSTDVIARAVRRARRRSGRTWTVLNVERNVVVR